MRNEGGSGAPQQKARRIQPWSIAKVALALALVGFVLTQLRVEDALALWRRMELAWLFPSVLCFWLIIWLGARRSWHLLDRQIPFPELLEIVVVQTVVGNLLANAAGVASYIGLLRGKHQVRLAQSVSSVLLGKIGDLLALLTGLTAAAWLVWAQIEPLRGVVLVLLLGLFSATGAGFLLYLFRGSAVPWCRAAAGWLGRRELPGVERLERFVAAIGRSDSPGPATDLASFALYSALGTAAAVAFAYCNMQLFSIDLELGPLLFITVFSQLIALVPIQVFGGLGVFEVTGLFLYGLFGVEQSTLVPFLVGARLYLYVLNLLLLPYLAYESRLASALQHARLARRRPL